MTEYAKLIERLGERYGEPDLSTEQLLNRRDRKRRIQRITAGVVGIGLFVAAVWVVTTVGSLDRSQTPAVPGGAETGPAVSGPTATPKAEWDGSGIPSEGTAPSTPAEGELIAQHGGRVGIGSVFVYSDGRVLWGASLGQGLAPAFVLERRLSPAAVELVRSGGIQVKDLLPPQVLHGIPTSAWVEAEARLYVPSRYVVCFEGDVSLDPSAVTSKLPAPAEALLRGTDHNPLRSECLDLTTAEARAFDQDLSEGGLAPREPGLQSAASWLLRDDGGDQVEISINPVFPDGRWWDISYRPHL